MITKLIKKMFGVKSESVDHPYIYGCIAGLDDRIDLIDNRLNTHNTSLFCFKDKCESDFENMKNVIEQQIAIIQRMGKRIARLEEFQDDRAALGKALNSWRKDHPQVRSDYNSEAVTRIIVDKFEEIEKLCVEYDAKICKANSNLMWCKGQLSVAKSILEIIRRTA